MKNNKKTLAIILVIEEDVARAEQLRDMIEFLDAPQVRIARDDDWQAVAGDASVNAIFIGNGLAEDRRQALAAEIGESHPQVPLVMVAAEHA